MLAKLNRNQRLQRASDPATPVEELLSLALEFPETVATNPTLSLAVSADPGVLSSADPVALACIITSPDATAPLAQAMMAISLRTLDEDIGSQLRDYLKQWLACECGCCSVDLTSLTPASSIPLTIEQGIRGRAILLQRLGRDRVAHVEVSAPSMCISSSDVFTPPPDNSEADCLWEESLGILKLCCKPTLGGITDEYKQTLVIGPTPSSPLQAGLCVEEQITGGFILAEFTGGIEPTRCDVEMHTAESYETANVPTPADTNAKASFILDPWRSAAKALPAGQFLIIDHQHVKFGTPNEVRLALHESRKKSNELDEDEEDEFGKEGQSMTEALKQCVCRPCFCPRYGKAPFLSEGNLKDAPFGAEALGGAESIQQRLESLAKLLPIAAPKIPRMRGDYRYHFVIMDGDKYAALFVGDGKWLKSLHFATVELDPMNWAT